MSSREYAEWRAYYDLEPFGERRADLRSATVCAVTANALGGAHSKPADFMPDFDRAPVQQESVAVMRAKLRAAIGLGNKGMKNGR